MVQSYNPNPQLVAEIEDKAMRVISFGTNDHIQNYGYCMRMLSQLNVAYNNN